MSEGGWRGKRAGSPGLSCGSANQATSWCSTSRRTDWSSFTVPDRGFSQQGSGQAGATNRSPHRARLVGAVLFLVIAAASAPAIAEKADQAGANSSDTSSAPQKPSAKLRANGTWSSSDGISQGTWEAGLEVDPAGTVAGRFRFTGGASSYRWLDTVGTMSWSDIELAVTNPEQGTTRLTGAVHGVMIEGSLLFPDGRSESWAGWWTKDEPDPDSDD